MVFRYGGEGIGEGCILLGSLGKGGLKVISRQGAMSSWELLRVELSPCTIDQL